MHRADYAVASCLSVRLTVRHTTVLCFWYFIISSYMFIVLFVLGALWHLFDKRIFDWIGLNWYCIETAKHIIKFFHHLVGPPFYES